MQVNAQQLQKELYYHPAWSEDRDIFMKFLNKSYFSDQDLIILARLYVKYSHIHCFQKSELTSYFNYILRKMQMHDSQELFNRAHSIYKKLEGLS